MSGDLGETGRGRSQLEQLFASAEAMWRDGKFGEAEQTFRDILDVTPHDCRTLLWLGILLAQTGRVDEGISTLERLLKVDPRSFEAMNWLAAMLREKGQFERAANFGVKAVEIKPTADGFTNLGQCYFAAGQFEEAGTAFRKAAELKPDAVSYRNLALALERQNRIKDAEWACREGLAKEASDPELNFQLGQLLLHHDQSKASVPHLRLAYLADPKSIQRGLLLAQALQEDYQQDEAEVVAKAVLEIEPNEALALSILGAVEQYRGRFEEANRYLDKALAADPDLIAPYFDRVFGNKLTLADAFLIDEMERILHSEAVDENQARFLHYGIGKGLNDLGDYSAAISHFDAANKISKKVMDERGEGFDRAQFLKRCQKKIDIFNESFINRYSKGISSSDTPIFVLGMMRSGTTLTEQILSSHPQIGGAGELPFWTEHVWKTMDSTGKAIDPWKAQELANSYLDKLHTAAPGYDRVVDKMPRNWMNVGLISAVFPNARFIHCRRNPADNCFSIYVTPFRHSPEFGHDRENIAFAYRQYRRMMNHWRAVLPEGRMFEVDYEELVTDREKVSRQMLEFLGLPWNDACLEHEKNDRVVQTASKWQARQPIYKTSVERWRRYEPWLGPFKDLLDEYCPEAA